MDFSLRLLLVVAAFVVVATTKAESTTTNNNDDNNNNNSSDPWDSRVPVIDLASANEETIVQGIHDACQTIGFFMIRNHGVDPTIVEKARIVSKDFFGLPDPQKLQHKSSQQVEYPYGYEQSEQLTKGKRLDDPDNDDDDDDHTFDLKETFAIGPDDLESGMPLRRWIPTPTIPDFSKTLEDYYAQMEVLSLKLLEYFALALGQSKDYFVDKMTHHTSALRLVHYYPLRPEQRPTSNDTELVRAGAHTDYGAFTILNPYNSAGLQVLLNHTEWYGVPIIPGALVINLGDLMQRWTNDQWISTLHRVVLPTNMEQRYSMAYFVNINGDTLVKSLGAGSATPKYAPITAKEHLMAKHLASMGEASSHEEL